MQTFLPFPNFTMSALVLDQKRLGKQRVETLQILKVLQKGKYYCDDCQKTVTHINPYKTGFHCYDCEAPLKMTAWYNHPAVQMWKGYSGALYLYLTETCKVWTDRGFEDTCLESAKKFVANGAPILLPDWFGNPTFHRSHQSNLLRKDPEHYGQYFLGVPDDLPYVWPSKELCLQ